MGTILEEQSQGKGTFVEWEIVSGVFLKNIVTQLTLNSYNCSNEWMLYWEKIFESIFVAVVILIFQTGFPKVSSSWRHYSTVSAFTTLMERTYTGRTFSAIFLDRMGSVLLNSPKIPSLWYKPF